MCDWDSDSEYSSSCSDNECDRGGYDMFSYAGKFLGDLIWGSGDDCCEQRSGCGRNGGTCGRRKPEKSDKRSSCKKSGGSCGCGCKGSAGTSKSACGRSSGGSSRSESGGSCYRSGGGASCSRKSAGRSPGGGGGGGGGSCSRKTRAAPCGRSPVSKPSKQAKTRNCCRK